MSRAAAAQVVEMVFIRDDSERLFSALSGLIVRPVALTEGTLSALHR